MEQQEQSVNKDWKKKLKKRLQRFSPGLAFSFTAAATI